MFSINEMEGMIMKKYLLILLIIGSYSCSYTNLASNMENQLWQEAVHREAVRYGMPQLRQAILDAKNPEDFNIAVQKYNAAIKKYDLDKKIGLKEYTGSYQNR